MLKWHSCPVIPWEKMRSSLDRQHARHMACDGQYKKKRVTKRDTTGNRPPNDAIFVPGSSHEKVEQSNDEAMMEQYGNESFDEKE